MSCLALKRNGSLCKNYACLELEDGKEVRGFTCHQHKNYFDHPEKVKADWIVPPGRWIQNTQGVGLYIEYYPQHFYHIEECLRLGLVTITKKDIQRIHSSSARNYSKWAVFVLLVARHTPEFRPSWHPTLWRATIWHMWRLVQSIGPMEFKWSDIQTLICFQDDISTWYRAMEYYPFIDPDIGFTKEEFYRFFEDCLKDKEFRLAFVLEQEGEILKRIERTEDGIISTSQRILESEEFLEWRRKLKASWYAEQKARCDVFKEELMAVSWHPDRFMEHCLDWEEKRDILGRW